MPAAAIAEPQTISASEDALNRAPKTAAAPRRFDFAHKVFAAPKAAFVRDDTTQEPVLCVDLGDLRAAMSIDALRAYFKIAPDSEDGKLLEEVPRALKYVAAVHPGDTIPSELLDGTASWKVDKIHLETAHGRIAAGLLAWLGEGSKAESAVEFAALASDPAVKSKVQEAFSRLAQRMGLPDDRKSEVVDSVEKLARELSYIEALRDKVGQMRRLIDLFRRLRVGYKRERGVADSLARIVQLLDKPVRRYEQRLEEVDAQTGETANTIVNLGRQIVYVREARDWLHGETMRWDDILATWAGETLDRTPAQQRKVAATYRFAARHFPIDETWASG
jgi:hypothetical protein